MSPDARLRSLERHRETPEQEAAYLRARIRAGELPAALVGPLLDPIRLGRVGRAELELLAYLGDDGARLLCGPDAPGSAWGWGAADESDLSAWVNSVGHVAEPLPNVPGEGERGCPDCDGLIKLQFDCQRCDGTGRVPYTVPAPRYLLALAAHAAGREALPGWERSIMEDCRTLTLRIRPGETQEEAIDREVLADRQRRMEQEVEPARRALDACLDWLRCPCEEHERAWEQASAHVNGDWPTTDALRRPEWACRVVIAAARLIGDARARSSVCSALVAWVLRGEIAGEPVGHRRPSEPR